MTDVHLIIPDSTETRATVIYWHVKVGDRVAEGQDIAELSTAKTVFVIQSPVTGIITAINFSTDAAVTAGDVLCSVQTD